MEIERIKENVLKCKERMWEWYNDILIKNKSSMIDGIMILKLIK